MQISKIKDAVGDENIIIFGMKTEEVNDLKRTGYNPESYYESNPVIKNCIDRMYHGINGCNFNEVANSLKNSDPYMVLADFVPIEKLRLIHQNAIKTARNGLRCHLTISPVPEYSQLTEL